ncbi:MAG: TetR family transcriptional regulator [Catenulispora sp. 13_1_20CM_3_70_7]|nr:TetR/AcrR family transcriptional regulator [Catenulisporales bacterium]OLE21999.1 MAG: TetR family transcriptional regulator [Catenulispora sp. 13_1_20CM_3_70_7]
MPTGIAIRDPHEQLFAAAERVLLRSGPEALTSRAVTEEAGVAKGVLHRHFADFDDFLTEYVQQQARGVTELEERFRARAGQASVIDNLAEALHALFTPLTTRIVALITFRDGLRSRLRASGARGVPILGEGKQMLAAYLAAERGLGRLLPDTDVDLMALMLIGTLHMTYADHGDEPPELEEVRRVVAGVVVLP